jgi:hypothetical protein
VPSRTYVNHDAVTLKCGMGRVMVATHYLAMPFLARQRSQSVQPWRWHCDGVDSFGASDIRGRSVQTLSGRSRF